MSVDLPHAPAIYLRGGRGVWIGSAAVMRKMHAMFLDLTGITVSLEQSAYSTTEGVGAFVEVCVVFLTGEMALVRLTSADITATSGSQ